jgi:hypothetical protein
MIIGDDAVVVVARNLEEARSLLARETFDLAERVNASLVKAKSASDLHAATIRSQISGRSIESLDQT